MTDYELTCQENKIKDDLADIAKRMRQAIANDGLEMHILSFFAGQVCEKASELELVEYKRQKIAERTEALNKKEPIYGEEETD